MGIDNFILRLMLTKLSIFLLCLAILDCFPSELEAGVEKLMAEQMEEAKGLLRLFPIWACCMGFTLVIAQFRTFFTKQGGTLYRKIGSNFQLPAAGLQGLYSATATLVIVMYDRIAVPLARNITGIPMSILWLFPQYILVGFTAAFSITGMQEFFYDQMPDSLRSFGVAICLSTFGFGSLINSLLVYVIDKATIRITGESWFSNNLNRAHLDYFWLIAGINVCSFVVFVFFARSYVYKKKKEIVVIARL